MHVTINLKSFPPVHGGRDSILSRRRKNAIKYLCLIKSALRMGNISCYKRRLCMVKSALGMGNISWYKRRLYMVKSSPTMGTISWCKRWLCMVKSSPRMAIYPGARGGSARLNLPQDGQYILVQEAALHG